MSTRANVIIQNEHQKLYFYRHSDGYPKCTGEDLKKFVVGYSGRMRLDPMQSAGWLIIRGHNEYLEQDKLMGIKHASIGLDWKVGAYEPTDQIHGDVEYVYVIDTDKLTLTCWDAHNGKMREMLSVHKFEGKP